MYAGKFRHLASTSHYIYNSLCTHLNKKATDFEKLTESYILCREIGTIVNKFSQDLIGKAKLIDHDLPVVLFTTQSNKVPFSYQALSQDESVFAIDLLLDIWTYRKPISSITS